MTALLINAIHIFGSLAEPLKLYLFSETSLCNRSIAEAAASIWGAENFSLKSKGKNTKKAKFKSLAEGSLMTASGIETPLAEEYLPGSSDPLYIDSQSDQSNLPYPSQRKRKAQKILGEEISVHMHSKKLRKEPFKDTGISMEKVVLLTL